MAEIGYKEANRRYLRLFVPAMLFYLVILLGGSMWLKQMDEAPVWARGGVAVLSALPVIAALGVMLRHAFETDEFTRQKSFIAMAIAGVTLASVAMLLGLLQMFEVIGAVDVVWFAPAFFAIYGLLRMRLAESPCA